MAIGLAVAAGRLAARYRHGSQAFRLTLLTLPMIAPAFAFYPTVVQLARDAKEEFVEASYAPQVRNLRQNVQMQVQQSLSQIDAIPELVDLITTKVTPDSETLTDRAFQVWQSTALATYPITSSVELYGPDGKLVSRFAFNLPEDLTAPPTSEERSCEWDLYDEVAPFFAEERRVLHAGRAFCSSDPNAKPLGSIVVHALPDDYGNLPFISSRNPYVELLLPPDRLAARRTHRARCRVRGLRVEPLDHSTQMARPRGRFPTRCSRASRIRATRSGHSSPAGSSATTSTFSTIAAAFMRSGFR